jgi:hypothetical protein
MATRMSPNGTATGLRPIAIVAGALALMGMSDVDPGNPTPCRAATALVRVYEGSRLFEAPSARLELARGRALGCDSPRVERVLTALEGALSSLGFGHPSPPPERHALERHLPETLGVHLDPQLPGHHAPLAGIEVHVSSREVLVAVSALDELGGEAWRHELLHAMAPPPPPLQPDARRLWLTLEEAVVGHLARAPNALERGRVDSGLDEGGESGNDARLDGRSPPPSQVVPLLEWLASPAYDPHPLAARLARELERLAPSPAIESWLACLAADPESGRAPSRPGSEAFTGTFASALPVALAGVFAPFIARCPADVAASLSAAIDAGWGTAALEQRTIPAADIAHRARALPAPEK